MMFEWSDAWLLLALIYSGEPADRERLRSIGDSINHAIFTDEELDGGLARLQRTGHVSAVGDKYSPSADVLAWYTSITEGQARTAVHRDLERVSEFLRDIEMDLNEIVDAWIVAENAEHGSAEYESNWWAIEQVMDWALESEGEQLWRFITAAYKRDLSDKAVGVLAAGPLEDLLAKQGPQFIARVEELARRDPRFNYLLGGMWRNTMTDDIWQRVQAARHEVW